MSRVSRNAFGAAAGLAADQMFGEPPLPGHLHPVAILGSVALQVERSLYADRYRNGVAHAGIGAGVAVAAGLGVRSTAVATYVTTSGRALHTVAAEIGTALESEDLTTARRLLPNLVGRDPSGLDSPAIARAVVESVAENTTDAIVAPALWALAGGAPGTFLHRAGDTLDSMVGYRNARYERFGAGAARLDDILAWLPARMTAALVATVRLRRAGAIVRAVRTDAPAHPSPNAGVAEAAFAAALGVRLGGPNRYGDRWEHRPALGCGPDPAPRDIPAAIGISRDVTWALAGLLVATGVAGRRLTGRKRKRHRS